MNVLSKIFQSLTLIISFAGILKAQTHHASTVEQVHLANYLSSQDFSLSVLSNYRLNAPPFKGTSNYQFLLNYSDVNSNYKVNSSLKYFKEVNRFSFSIPELYYKKNTTSTLLSLGRRIIPWHKNEQFWQLGHVNSVRGYRLLDEIQEGLTGIYLAKKINKNFKFNLFFSYIYLPQMNPGFDAKNGKINNRTDWGVVHPTEVNLQNGRSYDIKYYINKKNLNDIIFQKSLGGRLSYSYSNFRFSMFSIYKPESKLRISADYAPNEFLDAIVEIEPEVNHHLVTGVEAKYVFLNNLFVAGIVDVDPLASIGKDLDLYTIKQRAKQEFSFDYFSYKPRYERERYFHTSYYFKNKYFNGQVSYLHYLTNHDDGNDSMSTSAVKWARAIGFSMNRNLTNWWNTTVSIKYDLKKHDNILNIDNVFLYKKISLTLGVQLLKAPLSNSYWSSFRANDSIYSTLKYNL